MERKDLLLFLKLHVIKKYLVILAWILEPLSTVIITEIGERPSLLVPLFSLHNTLNKYYSYVTYINFSFVQ